MAPHDIAVIFLDIVIMLSIALSFGHLMRRLHIPSIVGELIGGIVIGPTVLGRLSPNAYDWLFPNVGPAYMGIDVLTQICVLFFLFFVGLEVDIGMIKKRLYNIAWTSLMGIALPFVLGFSLVILSPQLWGGHAQSMLKLLALFIGTAFSISALPVIARMLKDMGLLKTDTGMIVMGVATINDLVGWSLFTLVLNEFAYRDVPGLSPYTSFIVVLLTLMFLLMAGRVLAQKALQWLKPCSACYMGLAMVFMLLAVVIVELMGIHAAFGAFMAGAAFSRGSDKRIEANDMLSRLVMCFFAPIYFVSIGLRADFFKSFDLLLAAATLLMACAGKVIGATLGAKISGLPSRQAAAIGIALNSRGAMEMVLARVARDAGLIDDRIFVALIIMAVITSIISGPMIKRLATAE
ncbi:transporter, CPA2 family [Methanocella conradii HZ254]|uniref:Transporter, CPA2 family n=1 Tax=Methanocella conradii (strain DSM 24694 / JCM 17849 / CGMCC 1.5162 / HZ254) TaxID=1041930 RepID=H8I7V3_METCZ|nr:cation:proton antiporter [Methanocella conradii]AFD00353.1 transporter, CPA2 family [Methanocella conradii HZ254]